MKPCGTEAAAQRHRRRGEPLCEPCRLAANAARNKYPRKRPEPAWRGRDAILDWLDLDGGWLTAPGIAADLGRNYQAVERVLRQLRSEGLVVSRVVELAHAVGSIGYHQRTEWRAK